MKTTMFKNWIAVYSVVLTATAIFPAAADQAAAMARPEKSCTGTITSVDLRENTLEMKGLLMHKKFNLGGTCTYALLDKGTGTAGDLRPGEKVRVSYQDAQGVLIADRIEQQPMRFEGRVMAIDAEKHTLKLHQHGMTRELQIADGCKIVLREGKSGTFADVRTGDYVTVTYETPAGKPAAREIAQTSIEFTGTLTAIDLDERTLKARAMFDTKKFNVADNCTVVINGKPGGQLSDLKPNEKLVLNYDEINGVNVVNRIAPAEEAPTNSVAATASAGGS
jgi:predicted RNA-binding protein